MTAVEIDAEIERLTALKIALDSPKYQPGDLVYLAGRVLRIDLNGEIAIEVVVNWTHTRELVISLHPSHPTVIRPY